MRAQRVWNPIGSVKTNTEIECLLLELATLNTRIEGLEQQHPEASKIQALRASALVLARQIDEIRCSTAGDLTDYSRSSPRAETGVWTVFCGEENRSM